MPDALTQGLAAGLLFALLAPALILGQIARRAFAAGEGRVGGDGLGAVAICVMGFTPAWLVARLLDAPGPTAELWLALGWPLAALAVAVLVGTWLFAGLGRTWRALALDPRAATAIGLHVRPARTAAVAVAAAFALLAGALLALRPETADAPTLVTLVALVAAVGPGGLLPAIGLGVGAGLAGGLASLVLPPPWPTLVAPILFLTALLARAGRLDGDVPHHA